MINFLPVTAITGDLFDQKYASLEYRDVLSKLEAEMAWKGYVVADRAISDPNGAWNEAISLDERVLDSGTSKTQILYWISTRSGFNVFAVDTNSTSGDAGTDDTSVSERSCAGVTACAALDLHGDCCPSLDGTMLGCCTRNGA
jgi:Glycosyl hydrolase family 81 C-terminal domain